MKSPRSTRRTATTASGVSLSTAVLPEGWRERLVPFVRDDAEPAEAACLELYDIAAAKLVAGREKDHEYVSALIEADLLQVATLGERSSCSPAPGQCARVLAWLERHQPG